MNTLTTAVTDKMKPKMAVVVYQGRDHSDVYLEHRDIIDGKMGAGKPMRKKTIINIMQALAEDEANLEKGYHGVIPPTLLYADTTTGRVKLVWYNKPKKRKLYFSQSLGIKDGEVTVPGILYVAENSTLKVYAFKGRKPKEALFRAPFFNVSDESVCLGNAKVKTPELRTFQSAIEYWETMFWQSEFSHILGDNPIDGNLATITKQCIADGEPFPTCVLKKSKHTLQEFLK